MTHDEVRKRAKDDGIQFFLAQFVEMHGKPNAKLMPVQAIDDLLEEGAGFAGFAAGPIGQTPASPDMLAVPDTSSYTRVPWQPDLARFACDVTVEGEAWPYCPRTILRNAVARAAKLGFSLKMGLEAEFFLVRKDDDGQLVVDDPLDTSEQPCYDAKALYRNYEFLTTLSRYANELGYGNYANDHEDANGQFESNFAYDDALVTCDRAIFFRYMVHVMAQQRGKLATFMPKPFGHLTGNGCHFHISLWDKAGKKNLFEDAKDSQRLRAVGDRLPLHRRPDPPRGRGLGDRRAHGQLLQAHRRRRARLRRHLVAGLRGLGRQQPHADDPRAGRPAHRAPRHRRLGQPVPRGDRRARRRPRRHRAQARPGPAEHRQPVHGDARRRSAASASRACRRRSPTPRCSCARTPSCATGSATRAPSTTATTSPTRSCASSRSGTRTCPRWEVDRYLTLF